MVIPTSLLGLHQKNSIEAATKITIPIIALFLLKASPVFGLELPEGEDESVGLLPEVLLGALVLVADGAVPLGDITLSRT